MVSVKDTSSPPATHHHRMPLDAKPLLYFLLIMFVEIGSNLYKNIPRYNCTEVTFFSKKIMKYEGIVTCVYNELINNLISFYKFHFIF